MKALLATMTAIGFAIAAPSAAPAQTITYYPSTAQSYYAPSYYIDPATGATVAYPTTVYSYGYNSGYYGPRFYNAPNYYRPYYGGYRYYQPYYNGYSYYRPWRWR